jgi:hypothetical protein
VDDKAISHGDSQNKKPGSFYDVGSFETDFRAFFPELVEPEDLAGKLYSMP